MRLVDDPAPEDGHALGDIDIRNRSTVVVAVSGGSDSMALLHLAAATLGRGRLLAVTVNHQLRPEAASEAQWVGACCAAMGIHHRIVTWHQNDRGVSGGLISRAREARYRLLAEAAAEASTDLVLLGHTADDQAETVEMRRRRCSRGSSFARGRAGMAPAVLFGGQVWFARPLLSSSRNVLRAYLIAQGAKWIDDPTNEDMRYERARIRSELGREEKSCQHGALLELARQAAWQRRCIDAEAAKCVARHAYMPSPGLFRLDPAFLSTTCMDAALHAFRALLATVGGRDQLPDEARTHRFLEQLETPGFCATLSRTRVEVHRQGIFLCRENRSLSHETAVEGMIWDGRYRLAELDGRGKWMIGPVGSSGAGELGGEFPEVSQRLVRAGLLAEPHLWPLDPEGEPSNGPTKTRLSRVASPFARFLGEFDLCLAAALSRLVGASAPPPSPFVRHIAD